MKETLKGGFSGGKDGAVVTVVFKLFLYFVFKVFFLSELSESVVNSLGQLRFS